jgi:hypothetical protein
MSEAGPSPSPGRLARLGISREQLLFWLLLELWVLNAADLLLTHYALWLGFATESNGIMRYFLHEGTLTATVFKIGMVSIGVLLLWRLRRRPTALAAARRLRRTSYPRTSAHFRATLRSPPSILPVDAAPGPRYTSVSSPVEKSIQRKSHLTASLPTARRRVYGHG